MCKTPDSEWIECICFPVLHSVKNSHNHQTNGTHTKTKAFVKSYVFLESHTCNASTREVADWSGVQGHPWLNSSD